jgi:hypothetical protein
VCSKYHNSSFASLRLSLPYVLWIFSSLPLVQLSCFFTPMSHYQIPVHLGRTDSPMSYLVTVLEAEQSPRGWATHRFFFHSDASSGSYFIRYHIPKHITVARLLSSGMWRRASSRSFTTFRRSLLQYHSEDESSRFSRNIGKCLPDYMAPHPRCILHFPLYACKSTCICLYSDGNISNSGGMGGMDVLIF